MLKASVYRTLLSSRHIVRGAGARGALAAVSFSASSSEAAWSSSSSYSSTALAAALSAALVAGAVALSASASPAHCDVHKPTAEDSLPVYRLSEVANHKTNKTRVWVTYGDGVYDITDFIPNHPGGEDKIRMAAGQPIEPYWNLYRQHYNSALPMQLLEGMKVGHLHPEDVEKLQAKQAKDESDPYANDPEISPMLRVLQSQPINAEPASSSIITNSWITPNELWFVRNHHPVPQIDASTFELSVGGHKYTMRDLKAMKKETVISTIECGGNRREDMNLRGGKSVATLGSPWRIGAMSNAEWGGVKLRDLIKSSGAFKEYFDKHPNADKGSLHVIFHSADGLMASIPFRKAMSTYGDTLIAYEMNGAPIPPEHGAPLRVIVPGHVGVRNVKWVNSITISAEEASGTWQRGIAYKGFGPSTMTTNNLDVPKIQSVQEMGVQSAITVPDAYAHPTFTPGPQKLKGYAYSGGGRGIVRVDISIDNGKTWKTATLKEGSDQPMDRAWAWTFWECDVDVPADVSSVTLVCKATDASYNVQPDSVEGIWNLRGINNNAWHRVVVDVRP